LAKTLSTCPTRTRVAPEWLKKGLRSIPLQGTKSELLRKRAARGVIHSTWDAWGVSLDATPGPTTKAQRLKAFDLKGGAHRTFPLRPSRKDIWTGDGKTYVLKARRDDSPACSRPKGKGKGLKSGFKRKVNLKEAGQPVGGARGGSRWGERYHFSFCTREKRNDSRRPHDGKQSEGKGKGPTAGVKLLRNSFMQGFGPVDHTV